MSFDFWYGKVCYPLETTDEMVDENILSFGEDVF